MSLQREVKEARNYLATINKQIEDAELLGNNRLRVLQGEVDILEKKKAVLLKELIHLKEQVAKYKQ